MRREMDVLNFIATIVKALAWPSVVIVVVLLLRNPLSNSIPLLRRFNALGIEFEFSDQLAEVSEKSRTYPTLTLTFLKTLQQL
jgi:hypothetical protein